MESPDIPPPATNPYRQLLSRRFPEPLLLLLVFVLGVWLWDNHFGRKIMPFAPAERVETWELAMRKADRDLRLAEGTADMPFWVQPLLGIEPMPQTLDRHIRNFESLVYSRHRHDEDELTRIVSDRGAFALGVMMASHGEGDPSNAPFARLGIPGPPQPGAILSRIIDGQEHWWDMAYLRDLQIPESDIATQGVSARTQHLVNNTIKARGSVVALTLGGLVFLPGTLIAFVRAGRRRGPPKYPEKWKLSFGLGVFLLAYLAYLGFNITFNQGLEIIAAKADPDSGPLLSMPTFITIDSLTRFLPALIALGLLFRRPRHAISRLGLAGPINGRMVLGAFSILQIIEFGLRMTLDVHAEPDPTGGLSSNEIGPWGLVFGVASACIAAPIAEEILYRGVLYRSLANRIRIWPAILISSVLFALVHFYPLSSLITVGAVGAVCALCYASSRTLLTAIVLHALYNAAIKIPEWIVYQTALS